MDAQAKKKALFRAKLNAQKKEKRIESPLVRLVLGAHHVIFPFPASIYFTLHKFAYGFFYLLYVICYAVSVIQFIYSPFMVLFIILLKMTLRFLNTFCF